MAGRIINGTKNIGLCDPNELKLQTLLDNVKYTLRDIIWTNSECSISYEANNFITELSANELDNDIKSRLYAFFNKLRQSDFVFTNDEPDNENGYMLLKDWWLQMRQLVQLLKPPVTTMIINSSSYQFQISYLKESDQYFVCGIHGFVYQCEDDIGEHCTNAEQVLQVIKQWIPTWCVASVVTYTDSTDNSELICSRVFQTMDSNKFTDYVDALKTY